MLPTQRLEDIADVDIVEALAGAGLTFGVSVWHMCDLLRLEYPRRGHYERYAGRIARVPGIIHHDNCFMLSPVEWARRLVGKSETEIATLLKGVRRVPGT
jgi:hypothetical protein